MVEVELLLRSSAQISHLQGATLNVQCMYSIAKDHSNSQHAVDADDRLVGAFIGEPGIPLKQDRYCRARLTGVSRCQMKLTT